MIFELLELILGKELYLIKFIVVYLTETKIDDGATKLQNAVNDEYLIVGRHVYESCIVYELLKVRREKGLFRK